MKLSFKRISLSIFLLFLAFAGYWLLRYYVWQPLDFDDYIGKLYWEIAPENPEGYTQLLPATPLDPLLLPLTADARGLHHLLNRSRSPQQAADLAQSRLADLYTYRETALSPAQLLIYDQWQEHLTRDIESAAFPSLHFPLNAFDGDPWTVLQLLLTTHPVADTEGADAYLSRMRKLPDVIARAMKRSAAYEQQQLVAPRSLWQRAHDQLQTQVNLPPTQSPLYLHLARLLSLSNPTAINEGAQVEYLIRAEKTIEERVYPAFRDLIAYMETQLAQAPEQAGIWQYPNGEEAYAFALRSYAGVAVSPDTAWQWGLRAVAAAQQPLAEALETAVVSAGIAAHPADTLRRYAEDFAERGTGLFETLPGARFQLFAVDTLGGFMGGYYCAASRDGSREAMLFFDNHDLLQSTSYRHLLPGKHLLWSQMLADPDVPNLLLSLPQPAFEEGWAAYAHDLAMEYGFFQETAHVAEYYRQTLLDGALLVLDVGIHHKRWERSAAIDYLISTAGQARETATWLTDQCIAQPGSAIAAVAGKQKIRALRKRAETELGQRFQIRDFHRAIMARGPLSLPLLEKSIEMYILSAKEAD